jgi:uncharacterized protein (TIGR02246 family)
MKGRLWQWSSVGIVLCTACSGSGARLVTSPGAAQQVRAGHEALNRALRSGDRETWLSWYLDDAEILVPNRPAITGRSAIRAHVESLPPVVDGGVEVIRLEVAGDVGYVRGRYRLWMRMPDGSVAADSGKSVTVWRRTSAGAWRVQVDMSSSDVPRRR